MASLPLFGFLASRIRIEQCHVAHYSSDFPRPKSSLQAARNGSYHTRAYPFPCLFWLLRQEYVYTYCSVLFVADFCVKGTICFLFVTLPKCATIYKHPLFFLKRFCFLCYNLDIYTYISVIYSYLLLLLFSTLAFTFSLLFIHLLINLFFFIFFIFLISACIMVFLRIHTLLKMYTNFICLLRDVTKTVGHVFISFKWASVLFF